MNGISQKNLLYGILGAMVADKKSDTDAKLPRNELVKAGLLNSIGGGENPMFSMLSAKMSAEDKIKAATLETDNAMLVAKVEKYRVAVEAIRLLVASTISNSVTTYSLTMDNDQVSTHIIDKFNLDGTLK